MAQRTSRKPKRNFSKTQLSTAVMLAIASPAAFGQAAEIDEIVVTAQKRSQSMQEVPISIEVLDSQTLRELNIQNFFDYAQMIPSIHSTPGMDEGSSWAAITMRAINSGSRGHASTNSPSVGMYLDEMPITNYQGNVDIHLYDIARVEVLAGPQGTLFGANTEGGTIRVISNAPDLENVSASVSAEGNTVKGGDAGYLLEGFVNVPIRDNMAVRLVGWARESGGWIDNVAGSRTFTGVEDPDMCAASGVLCGADDITMTNDDLAKKNYNTSEMVGGRAALRIDLNENWTVTPTVMGQRNKTKGHRGEDVSDFVSQEQAVTHFMPEFLEDKWHMIGLTIEGKIGNFDLVYSGGSMRRDVDGSSDYADYAYWYDNYYTTGYYADLHFEDTGDRTIDNQFFPLAGTRNMQGYKQEYYDYYDRTTHELRLTTDPEKRVRGMLGFAYTDSYHDYTTTYVAPGLADSMEMHGGTRYLTDDTVYLNSMDRFDKDTAVFGNVDYDITDNLQLAVGARFFEPDQIVKGFTGYGSGFNGVWSSSGEGRCDLGEGDAGWTPNFNGQEDYQGKRTVKPCLNVDKHIKESESIYRVNLTWNASDDVMLYGTFSEGYRPGGVNRKPGQGEFLSEFLTNYEFGWKTQLMDNRLQFNGAVFYDEWEDFQITFAGEHAITQIGNGPSARIIGLEAQMTWLATDKLRITASGAKYDSELTSDFADYNDDGTIDEIMAPKGSPLPSTPGFKGNVVARYDFTVGSFDGYAQGVVAYTGKRRSSLEIEDYERIGDYPALTIVNLAAGIRKETWALDLFVKNATNEDTPWYDTAQCSAGTCLQRYIIRERPTTIAVKFTKDFDF